MDTAPLTATEFSSAVTAITGAFGDPTRRDIYLHVREADDGVTAAEAAVAQLPLQPPSSGWLVDDDPPYSPWRDVSLSTSSFCLLLPWWTILIIVVGILVITITMVGGFIWIKKYRSYQGQETQELS